MLIKKPNFKVCITVFYIIFFAVYFIIGFQPAAEAMDYKVSNELKIESINLNAPVTKLEIKSGKLETPVDIAGSYSITPNKTLLIGHASSIFKNLNLAKIGDKIEYEGDTYKIISTETMEKSAVNMERLLANTKKPTLKIMTCAGEYYNDGDASHRLIVTAIKEENSWKNYALLF